MINNEYIKDVIWAIEDLKKLDKFYEKEFERTKDTSFSLKKDQIEKYLFDYEEMVDKIESSIELRLYKYLNKGYRATKAVEKVAEENYFNDIEPSSVRRVWEHYKKLQRILKTAVK